MGRLGLALLVWLAIAAPAFAAPPGYLAAQAEFDGALSVESNYPRLAAQRFR